MTWTPRLVDDPADELDQDDDGLCDSCLRPLDPAEPGRWRHKACPPPRLPLTAVRAIERLRGEQ